MPLRQPLFRALWIATLVSNIGTWVHEVGAGWLMVTLDPHPLMVSLVQAATALPIFLLALPGGALSDIVDRRRYLIYTQIWMLVVVLALAASTALGWINAWGLLVFTFALACGAALNTPAWAATLPEIVPRAQLQSAIALNSLGINLARAVGPALAGVLVAAAGPQAAFLLNAVSFIGVIVVLLRWPRTPQPSTCASTIAAPQAMHPGSGACAPFIAATVRRVSPTGSPLMPSTKSAAKPFECSSLV